MTASVVVTAVYRAKDGEQERVAQFLREMARHSQSEPGCLRYLVNRGAEDERAFMLCETYRSMDAFEQHKQSEPFERLIRRGVWPALETRDVMFWRELDL